MFTGPDKKPSIGCLFFAFLLSLVAACPAFAGTLSIRIRATLAVENHVLKGTVDVANHGSERALRLKMEVLFPSETITFPEVPLLNANESKTFSLERDLGRIKNGTYPLPIVVTFHDLNLYPFSALSCATFIVGQEPKSGIVCSAKPLTMAREGTALILLENAEPYAKKITAALLLPGELTAPENQRTIQLEPAGRETLTFKILNAHALPGGSYPVSCVFQYETPEWHHAFVCQMSVRVTEGKNWFYRTRFFWLAGGAVLLLSLAVHGWMTRRSS